MKARYLLLVLFSWACAGAPAAMNTGGTEAQGNQPAPIPFPVLPLLMEYEYAPHYFMQWITDHPQYERIEASVSQTKPPAYQIVLTEKGSGRRVSYCSSEAKVKALESRGQEARLAKIEYSGSNAIGQAPSHAFRFADEKGQPIRWQFILASMPTEHGAGLTPQSEGSGLLLIYRDLGTAAAEGSAVQIGSKVIEAAPWPEISSPPYFVAYRGTYVDGVGIGVFPRGQESWRVTTSPKDLTVGSQWAMADDRGRLRQLQVKERRNDQLTITEMTNDPDLGSKLSVKARATAGGLALSSMAMIGPKEKQVRVSFSPDLDLTAGSSSSAFQIEINGHEKVVQGTVSLTKEGNTTSLRWQPKSPDWARARVLHSVVTTSATGYKIEVR